MPGIAVEIVIDAPASFVWSDIEDLGSHTEWMRDAAAIRFRGTQRAGVGTRFECDTVVGPFHTTDVMEITAWEPPRTMGVRHEGVVTGAGTFTIRPSGSACVFSWVETLSFPVWMGGPLGAAIARPVLRSIWRHNLQGLKQRVEHRWNEERSDA